MLLSVIVVSWNTNELLRKCIDSVLADTDSQDCEIIVIDNASTDGTVDMLRDKFPDIILIENQHNVGFGRANNQGILQSKGRYVLLLNPDTEIMTGAIPTMLNFLEQTPQAAAAGPRLLNLDRTLQYSCSPAPTIVSEFKRLFHLPGIRPDGYYAMESWNPSVPREVEILLGACLLIKRDALDTVGLFDTDYFMYSEEVDLCRRLWEQNWKLFWVPEAQVMHYGGQSTSQMASEMFLNLYQSKTIYFNKHYGQLHGWIYQLIIRFVALTRLLGMPVVWIFYPSKWKQQSNSFKNYQQLLFHSFIQNN